MARTATKRGVLAAIATATAGTSVANLAASVAPGAAVAWTTGAVQSFTRIPAYLSDEDVSFSMRNETVPVSITELGKVPNAILIRSMGIESFTFGIETMDADSVGIATNITTANNATSQSTSETKVAVALEISGVGILGFPKCGIDLEGGPDAGYAQPGKYTFKVTPHYTTGCPAGWEFIDFSG
jgi:hypothetical protein